MHLPLPPFFSLIPFLNNNTKKADRNKSQESFLKENKRMWGWNPQKPTKLNGNDTILSYHPYNLCHFANCTPQNSLHALSLFILNEQGTQLCSLHSLHIKDNPYLPCSAPIKISQHDLLTLIYHTDPALLMHYTVSAYKQDRPYLQCLV